MTSSCYFPLWHATLHPLKLSFFPPILPFFLLPLPHIASCHSFSSPTFNSISSCSFSSPLPSLVSNSSAQEQLLVLVCLKCSQKLRKSFLKLDGSPWTPEQGLPNLCVPPSHHGSPFRGEQLCRGWQSLKESYPGVHFLLDFPSKSPARCLFTWTLLAAQLHYTSLPSFIIKQNKNLPVMRFYPAGDQIPGESNLLLILLTNHQSITLPFCNDSNPIKASSDYFKHSSTDIWEARSQ